MSTKKLSEFDTGLTADTVEWCPNGGHESIAACGTYQLDTHSGRRHGSLSLFQWQQENGCAKAVQNTNLEFGVLDMKWKKDASQPLLALAASSGDIVLVSLNCKKDSYGSSEVGRITVARYPGLCLSLDWSADPSQLLLAVSDSAGEVSVVNSERGGGRGEGGGGGGGGGGFGQILYNWRAHEFEAWIVCLGPQAHMVFTGGDDSALRVWDTRAGLGRAVLTSKEHSMGVCSLQVHPLKSHLLASGSYDERVLLWDTRAMGGPLKTVGVGGGVWRVKWHPIHSDFMATACMHNGFHLLNWHLATDEPVETVCTYSQHGSLAYGVDWSRLDSKVALLASCSFYDHSLHFWTADIPFS